MQVQVQVQVHVQVQVQVQVAQLLSHSAHHLCPFGTSDNESTFARLC